MNVIHSYHGRNPWLFALTLHLRPYPVSSNEEAKWNLITSVISADRWLLQVFSEGGILKVPQEDFNQSHLSGILVSDYLRREKTANSPGCNCVYTTILLKQKKVMWLRGVFRSEALMRWHLINQQHSGGWKSGWVTSRVSSSPLLYVRSTKCCIFHWKTCAFIILNWFT